MDDIIQGLNQSAIVQTLSEAGHNIKRVVHDIPDNAPYRALSRQTVQAVSGDRNDPNATLRFKVPRRGQLIRMYLKASLHFPFQPLASGCESTLTQNSKAMGPHFFASFLTSASLFVGSRCIETVYPENILAKAFQASPSVADSILYGLKGRWSEFNEESAGQGHVDMVSSGAGLNLQKYANFIIPIDFSISQFHKDALDTTMLQNIVVQINKRAVRGFQTDISGAYTRCELVCEYFQLHSSLRNQIRNAKFPRETTTLLSLANEIVTDCQEEVIPAVEGAVTIITKVTQTDTYFQTLWTGENGVPAGQFQITGFAHTVPSEPAFFTFTNVNGMDLSGEYTYIPNPSSPNKPFMLLNRPNETLVYDIRYNTPAAPLRQVLNISADTLVTGDTITISNTPDFTSPINGTWTVTVIQDSPSTKITLDGYVDVPLTEAPTTAILTLTELVPTPTIVELEPEYKRCVFDLNSMNYFLKEILISFRKTEINDSSVFYGDIVSAPAKDGFLRFKIMVEDRVLFEKSHWEMLSDKMNVSNLDIQDANDEAYGLKVFTNGSDVARHYIQDTIDIPPEFHNANSLTLKHEAFMYRIPLSLFDSEEFQSGGLNMKTLTNVKLIIEGTELLDESDPTDQKGLTPHVILRRRNLNRIDAKTGTIHSTLN